MNMFRSPTGSSHSGSKRRVGIMKFSWFGITQATVNALANDLVDRHGTDAMETAMRMSELSFANGAVKDSKALWLAARAIMAANIAAR
jgi:hypothetical protein